MKIIVTGSLGHISKPLTETLVKAGHQVTVISSAPDRQKDIEALGATAATGALQDMDFLTKTFAGADAAYCMVPPVYNVPAVRDYYKGLARNYAAAIRTNGIKRVVHLSSYGADLDKGTGLILGAHDVEGIFNELDGVTLTHMRPAYFYYNLAQFIGMIRGAGSIMANYGADDSLVMVSPADIADAIAEELSTPTGSKVRYVASDERSGNEVAAVLGAAIGKPDLRWTLISDAEAQSGMEQHGIPAHLAADFTEMFAAIHSGILAADYYRHKPAVMGRVKLEDYAKEFAAAYHKRLNLLHEKHTDNQDQNHL